MEALDLRDFIDWEVSFIFKKNHFLDLENNTQFQKIQKDYKYMI